MAKNYKPKGNKFKLQQRKIKSVISKLHVLKNIFQKEIVHFYHILMMKVCTL